MGKEIKEANARSNVLKEKDIELLRLSEKASNLDKLMVNIKYYTKADKEKEAKIAILNSKIRVYTIEDLLYKYKDYAPEYNKDNSFYFGKALPIEVFNLFKVESARFNFTDLVIGGDDPDAGYRKFKQI